MIREIFRKTPCLFSFIIAYFQICCPASAQVSEGGIPPSFKYEQLLRSKTIKEIVSPNFDAEDLRTADELYEQGGSPMPVARLISVDYSMENSGHWTTLPDGQKIWQLEIRVPGALALMLYYEHFYIPRGGKLFVYSADKLQVLGAYTYNTHPSGGLFATEFTRGDEVILEYVASTDSDEQPTIKISEIGYGYNEIALRRLSSVALRTGPMASDECMINANCPEGDDWHNEKKGICQTVQKIGNKNYLCSGSLVNNTAEDHKPYILMARHCACADDTVADSLDMLQWLFYFHYLLDGCHDTSAPIESKSMIGCRLVFTSGTEGGSDGMLVLLNDTLPENYDVYYNGWNCSSDSPFLGVCLHHPQGDYMKISTYSGNTQVMTFGVNAFVCDENAHWGVLFVETESGYSVVQGGSSGAPLFNRDKHIVGTLTGTYFSCKYPKRFSLFGRMDYHWNKYKIEGDSLTALDYWLDPLKSGTQSFRGRFRSDELMKPPPENVAAYDYEYSIYLMWNLPKSDNFVPVKYLIYRNNIEIGETTSLFFTDKKPFIGRHSYAVSAVYENGEESFFTSVVVDHDFTYKPPTEIELESEYSHTNDYGYEIYSTRMNWKPPLYHQIVHWGCFEKINRVGLEGKTPFYFGHKWSPEELVYFHNKTLTSVAFYPVAGNMYEIYVKQGERKYRQKVDNTNDDNRMEVILKDAFAIDSSMPLYVAINVYVVNSDHPAVCDGGPAVDGKGNVCSFDGEQWFSINRYVADETNYNFALSATVSSQEGEQEIGTKTKNNAEIPTLGRKPILLHEKEVALYKETKPYRCNVVPAAFPEVIEYWIYDYDLDWDLLSLTWVTPHCYFNGSFLSPEAWIENRFCYYISAVYKDPNPVFGRIRSDYSEPVILPQFVSVEPIADEIELNPTRFSEYVLLKGHERVRRVEVISLNGQICLSIDHPENRISTSTLSPGFYIFRLYPKNGAEPKVVRALKTGR